MKVFTDVKQKAAAIERFIDRRMAALAHRGRGTPHPLEIHNTILERVEARVTAGPGGVHLFPYDRVTLELLAIDDGCAAALEAMFERDGGLQEKIRTRLAQRECEMPRTLTSTIRILRVSPPDWPVNEAYRLAFYRSGEDEREKRSLLADLMLILPPDRPGPTCRLADARTNVGRMPEVRDRHGRLIRRNAIVIPEAHDPRASVSRCHAHVDAAPSAGGPARYTLYDDVSKYGTRVVREGRTIPVQPGAVGVLLRDGDELYFGEARAVFRMSTA